MKTPKFENVPAYFDQDCRSSFQCSVKFMHLNQSSLLFSAITQVNGVTLDLDL